MADLDAQATVADDINNRIIGLDLDQMEYAISKDGGVTYGSYTSAESPDLNGNVMIKIRLKAQGSIPASKEIVLIFTSDYGDINEDGLIDVSDVTMAVEIALDYSGYNEDQIKRANVNDKMDATVDISDVVLLAKRAVGSTTFFPVDQPQ